MIEKETIEQLAKTWHIKPWQQEKHYIQSAILSQMGEYPLVFKGGTYLWFFHGLPRFSEDLDFTLKGELPESMSEKISKGLDLLEIPHSVKKIHNNQIALSFRISIRGPLYKNENSLCHVYIEISRRENVLLKTIPFELANSNYFLPATLIRGMALEEVAAEKIRAIMTRDKPRDVFDLAFLIQHKKVPYNEKHIQKKLNYYNEKFDNKKLIQKAKEKKKNWEKEMASIVLSKLPPFEQEIKTIQEWAGKQQQLPPPQTN